MMTEDDTEYLRRLEEFTNRRLNETAMAIRQSSTAAAPLCALDLADELLKAQDENRRLRIQLDELRHQAEG